MPENKRDRWYIFLLVVTAAILGGGAGVFGKIALTEIPPFSFTFLRFTAASLFLIPFSKGSFPVFSKEHSKIILFSLLASLNVILFAFGIKHTTANTGQVIYTAVPIISAILSFWFLKEKFGARKVAGVALGFLGAMFVVLLPFVTKGSEAGTLYGNSIIFLAMLSISFYFVWSKKFQSAYSPMQINNYFIFTTAFLALFLSLPDFLKEPYWWQNVSLKSLLALLFVAFFSTALYYLLHQIIVKKSTPVMASMILYIQPFKAFVLSYIFLAEKLTPLFLIGVLLSLLGVGIYNFSERDGRAL